MHFLNLRIKSWLILFCQTDMRILLYTHLIQSVLSVSRCSIKLLKALCYVLLLKVKFFFDIRKMVTSLYQIILLVKTSLNKFSSMKSVSLFQITLCKSIHKIWDSTDTDDDEWGWLLMQCNFNNDTCYQSNDGWISQQQQQKYTSDSFQEQNQWCRNQVQILTDITEGLYTIYWV